MKIPIPFVISLKKLPKLTDNTYNIKAVSILFSKPVLFLKKFKIKKRNNEKITVVIMTEII
jgi:hypothetical protein